jgi:hypothetical protein
VQLVDIGVPRARKQRWCNPMWFWSKAAPAFSGDGARIATAAAADAVIPCSDRHRLPKERQQFPISRANVRNSPRSEDMRDAVDLIVSPSARFRIVWLVL